MQYYIIIVIVYYTGLKTRELVSHNCVHDNNRHYSGSTSETCLQRPPVLCIIRPPLYNGGHLDPPLYNGGHLDMSQSYNYVVMYFHLHKNDKDHLC